MRLRFVLEMMARKQLLFSAWGGMKCGSSGRGVTRLVVAAGGLAEGTADGMEVAHWNVTFLELFHQIVELLRFYQSARGDIFVAELFQKERVPLG